MPSTSRQKISEGLANRDHGVILEPVPENPGGGPDLSEAPRNTSQVKTLAWNADQLAKSLNEKITDLNRLTEKARKRAEEMADEMNMRGQDRRKHVHNAISAKKRELFDSSDGERTRILQELMAAERQAKAAEQLFESPIQMLSAEGLGGEERSRYESQLANAGPQTLKGYAARAEAEGNRILGAALASIVDRMPVKKRPFNAQDLAQKLVGAEHEEVTGLLKATKNRASEAIKADREFRTGRRSTVGAISDALNRREEVEPTEPEEDAA